MPIDFEMEANSIMVQDTNKKNIYSMELFAKISFNSLDEGAIEIRHHLNCIADIIHNLQKPTTNE